MESKLYVGNLSYSTTEDELRTLFAQAGTVSSVALIKDRDSGQSKGFAFVEMSNQVEAEKAISMFNGHMVGERELKVSLARPAKTAVGLAAAPEEVATGPAVAVAGATKPILIDVNSPACRGVSFSVLPPRALPCTLVLSWYCTPASRTSRHTSRPTRSSTGFRSRRPRL